MNITLFTSGTHHLETIEPIGDEARSRGYDVRATDDLTASADVGIYCQHTHYIPKVNADLSVIMFHGLDMGYTERWPGENWSRFDIGLLPGRVSAQMWKDCADHPHAHPDIGVFNVGWPKSDPLYTTEFERAVEQYRNEIGVEGGRTVLYAPTKECAGKLYDFVENVHKNVETILIKHAPYEYESELASLYADLPDRAGLHILDRDDPIMYALSIADVVVSDESSVLQEAPLTDTIPVSVTDWPLRSPDSERTYNQLPEFTVNTEIVDLSQTIATIFGDYETHLKNLRTQRGDHYPNLGTSSAVVVDLIEAISKGEDYPIDPLRAPEYDLKEPSGWNPQLKIAKTYHRARYEFVHRLSEENEHRLKKLKLDKMLNKVDDLVDYKRYR